MPSYTNDCSTCAIAKIAAHTGYTGVNKRVLDLNIMSMNRKFGDDVNAQASVDMVHNLCGKFGWAIDIVVRTTHANGSVTMQQFPCPFAAKYWAPLPVIALEYNAATNSGHFEACKRDVYDADYTNTHYGFSWGYL